MFETYFMSCEVNIKAAQARSASDDVDSAASARGDSNDSAVIRPDPVTNVKSITFYVFKVRPRALATFQSSLTIRSLHRLNSYFSVHSYVYELLL